MSNKNLLYFLCGALYIGLITTSAISPESMLENYFLASFIKHELLSVLAVTTSVSMAWSGHLVTVLTRLEDKIDGLNFPKLKRTLKINIELLGGYFLLSIALLVIDSGISGSLIFRAFIYSSLLSILLMNIILMTQTHMLSLELPTKREFEEMLKEHSSSRL